MDKLDLGILECLALNCRLPHTVIADALGVAPNTVTHHIQLLENAQIIKQYAMTVDLRPFGFQRHHIMFRFNGQGDELHTVCRNLAKAAPAVWVASYTGTYDVQVIADTHLLLPLHEVLAALFARCGNNLRDYTVFSDHLDLEFTHCFPNFTRNPKLSLRDDGSFSQELCRRSFPNPEVSKAYNCSKIDIDLLQILAGNPRISITDLAKQVDAERQTVKKRLQRLIAAGVITSFGLGLDHQQLGFTAYHLLFRLQVGAPVAKQRQAFQNVEGVYYAGTAHGAYDLHGYLYTRTAQDLNRHVQRIRNTIGNLVMQTDLLVYDQVHHWRQFTPSTHRILLQLCGQ